MRALLFLCILATVALAGDWTSYSNMRFGVKIDVPPGWQAEPDPANGDGRTWLSADGLSGLMAWGRNLDEDFRTDVESRFYADMEVGWTMTYTRRGKLESTQPGEAWYVYSGTMDERVMYLKAMASCGGRQAIYVRIEYPESQLDAFTPLVERVAKSLRAGVALDCKSG